MSSSDMDEMLAPDARWRAWLRTHPVLGPAVIGVIATQMATLVGYFFPAVGLPALPWPLFNGILAAPATEYGTAASYFSGQSLHMVDGVVFTILFAVLLHRRLPLRNTTTGNVGKGLIYGTILAIISMGFLVPYAYVPRSGFGFFSFYTQDGWKLPFAILIWHLVYGFFVGVLYNTPDDDSSLSSR